MDSEKHHKNDDNKNTNQNELKFHFLSDDPVTEDEFGGHKRVADSIARKIEGDSSGATIGLEGTWGSGKSSVILMLQERWKERDDIHVFTFDAWAHQGDPLKRAFLEELITNLQTNSNEEEVWLSKRPDDCTPEYEKCENCSKRLKCRPDEIRDELRLRREHDTIASEPMVTDWGKAFAVATLAMPIGVALLSAAPKLTSWYFWLGTILASLPLIIIAACIVYRCFKKDHETNLLGEFVGKTKEITKHTTQRSIDPTSIEFREYYWEILKFALQDNNRKLVIVVDNLDRVESEVALSIWGTMQIFLEGRSTRESQVADRLWLVVPYDPSSVEKLWDERHKGMGRAFKEKSFQVNYRVATPLASRWEDYFKARLIEALPGQEPDTLHNIYHIFRIQALPAYGRQLPTPREMKIFINRMISLAQPHLIDMSLEEIALYSATELSETSRLANLAVYEPEREKFFAEFVGADWKSALAAIYFGVPREDAAEVLYEPIIRTYIEDGKSKELQKLLQNSGAENCCERYLQQQSKVMNADQLFKASAAFAEYTPDDASLYIRNSIKYLADRIYMLEDTNFKFDGKLNDSNAQDLVRLMKFQPSLCPIIRNKLSIGLEKEEIGPILDALEDTIRPWVKAAVKIVQHLSYEEDFEPTLRLNIPNTMIYLKILDTVIAEEDGKAVLKFFCPADPVLQVTLKDYCANIQKGEIRPVDIDIISCMLQMNCWKPQHIEKIASSLESLVKPDLDPVKTVYVLRILFEERTNPVFEQRLRNIAINGPLFEILQHHHAHAQCAAFCMITIMVYHPEPEFIAEHAAFTGQEKYRELLGNTVPNIAENTAKYCIELDFLNEVSQSVQNTDIADSEFLKAVLQNIVKQDTSTNYLAIDRFVSSHSLIYHHLDAKGDDQVNQYEVLVKKLLCEEGKNLLSVLEEHRTDIEFGHAYYIALNDEGLDTLRLAKKLCQDIKKSVGKDKWLEQLSNEDWMLDVVIELVNQDFKPELDNKFVNALIEHARLLLEGKVEVELLMESWSLLLDGLSEAERDQFKRKLLEMLIGAKKSILPLIILYNIEIENTIKSADKQTKKDFISQTCMNIAERNNKDEQQWMLTLLKSDPSQIKSATNNSKEALRNRLKPFWEQEYANLKHSQTEDVEAPASSDAEQDWLCVIENVAKQLGIKLEEEQDNKEKSEDNKDNLEENESSTDTEKHE